MSSFSSPKCFGYIFARGGSKGLPGKNLKKLGGVSLIGRAIQTALASHQIDEVFVSTDCPTIAAEAVRFGASVPCLRPAELASDTASEWLAWRHAIESLSPCCPDVFVSIPPTAPLRTTNDVDACINRLRASGAEIVLTVASPYRNPYFNQVQVDQRERVDLVMRNSQITRRQDAPDVYDITTVAYAAKPSAVLTRKGIFDCEVAHVEVPVERSIDIDTPLDFAIASFLYENATKQPVQAPTTEPTVTIPIRRAA
ncbi:N-acylneuraminate cytidylyltransferase [Neorhodopirellula lusitana]|uniref:N-acylneuraminate cytidylyltransferase n=1 Tax=Neorhodopirellula lusitana TaxID=445327 RepID=A0ABY1PUK6_9BACT|nr:acylneuraminate cytidylyltransferase family protein [Neorhodopirellula lusitana]SMP47700.1 N-acylneuraminate cytidylyltransferase [Neorhodopirellula lusitana]